MASEIAVTLLSFAARKAVEAYGPALISNFVWTGSELAGVQYGKGLAGHFVTDQSALGSGIHQACGALGGLSGNLFGIMVGPSVGLEVMNNPLVKTAINNGISFFASKTVSLVAGYCTSAPKSPSADRTQEGSASAETKDGLNSSIDIANDVWVVLPKDTYEKMQFYAPKDREDVKHMQTEFGKWQDANEKRRIEKQMTGPSDSKPMPIPSAA